MTEIIANPCVSKQSAIICTRPIFRYKNLYNVYTLKWQFKAIQFRSSRISLYNYKYTKKSDCFFTYEIIININEISKI